MLESGNVSFGELLVEKYVTDPETYWSDNKPVFKPDSVSFLYIWGSLGSRQVGEPAAFIIMFTVPAFPELFQALVKLHKYHGYHGIIDSLESTVLSVNLCMYLSLVTFFFQLFHNVQNSLDFSYYLHSFQISG